MTPNSHWNNPEEIEVFTQTVNKFLNNQIDAERFMAFRLQHGVYGQRQEGVHMVRVKLPAGRLFRHQLTTLNDILSTYCATDHASITTRQDIQFHFIKLENTPAVLSLLNKAGLTSREACGNTVRNITACTLSGVCPQQYTDITPYTEAVAQHFLRHPLTQHLPRKFKMSFSACPSDCAMGLMHDVGIIASQHNGSFGFKLLAAGGLGHKPRHAITVAHHLDTEELLPAIEAIISLHNRYSDRKRRAKARIKFLIEKFGEDLFREKFNEEFARAKLVLNSTPINSHWDNTCATNHAFKDGAPRATMLQKQPALSLIPIQLKLGQINCQQLTALDAIMQEHALTELRATSDQNLVLINIPTSRVERIVAQLTAANLNLPTHSDNIVACPGTSTCRLGITSSRTIASELANPADLRLRVSGCHNSCGQHHVADIGLHGEGNRVQGKLIPSYVLHLGGNGLANGAIALKGPTLPTRRAQVAITRISETYLNEARTQSFTAWVRQKPAAYFDELLNDLTTIAPEDIKDLARDIGETENFRVLQLGGGECAGAAQDHVAANFSEALHERNYCSAFFLQNKHTDALECAKQTVILTASSVLFLAGAKADTDLPALLTSFNKVLGHHDSLIQALTHLCKKIDQLTNGVDADSFKSLLSDLDAWITATANTCQEMDEQLNLASAELTDKPNDDHEQIIEFDLSSYECPLHYVKARNELRKLTSHQLVRLILEDEEAVRQVSLSLKKEGHEILETEPAGNFIALMVRRKE